ncbi:MAG: NAD(P)-dependent oxidoreductase [Puniceicoccaceae bacterium]
MKIVFFDIERWERETFEPLTEEHDVVFVDQPLTAETAPDHADAEIVSVFVKSQVSAEALDALPALKAIATRSTGFDHIDRGVCGERGIRIAYVPSYGENTVASHTIALLLNIAHRISDGIDRTRKGEFTNTGLQGFDVMGKRIGVIGAAGNIGRHVVTMAKGLGMEVLGFDVAEDPEFAREAGFEYVSMDDLLERSDVVTIHVPQNEKTKNLIDHGAFSKMREGVVFLNTSRGGVVDERALLKALSDNKVSAAGLDVLGAEPTIREEAELLRSAVEEEEKWGELLANEMLLRLRNVYVTPHNAFNTREAVQRILNVTLENLQGFISGEPVNLVGE